jgi:hypothetical protein
MHTRRRSSLLNNTSSPGAGPDRASPLQAGPCLAERQQFFTIASFPPDRLLFRVNDACQALGIGRSSFYKLVAEGKLTLISIAGRSVVSTENLLSFIRDL